MKVVAVIILGVYTCLILAGCAETIKGAGKDINRIGRRVSRVVGS